MANSEFILFLKIILIMWGQFAILFFGHQDARFHQKTVRISVSFTGEFSPKFWPEKYDFDLYKEFFTQKNGLI
jgi:hypothetical protein